MTEYFELGDYPVQVTPSTCVIIFIYYSIRSLHRFLLSLRRGLAGKVFADGLVIRGFVL